jgi:hypothetical protein
MQTPAELPSSVKPEEGTDTGECHRSPGRTCDAFGEVLRVYEYFKKERK